jgi:hypothetical protein
MPKGFQHISVPIFSAYDLALAELCALDLWNGIDYETGKENHISDEDLLHRFAAPVQSMLNNANTNQIITEHDIRQLVRVANLKALFRSKNPTDFQAGINAFKSEVLSDYTDWLNGATAASQSEIANKITLAWSQTFVRNSTGYTVHGNYRVPLAVRILFFALPDLMIFNFSNQLAEAMQLQKRPQAALPCFNALLEQGFIDNKHELDKLVMPRPALVRNEIWVKAEQNGWWKRRVIDLALLLHFNKTSYHPKHKSEAAHIAAMRN